MNGTPWSLNLKWGGVGGGGRAGGGMLTNVVTFPASERQNNIIDTVVVGRDVKAAEALSLSWEGYLYRIELHIF